MWNNARETVPGLPCDYRPDIDGLRALAVVSVIIFHYFPTWLPGGLVGVDVFFVISGYLISGHIVQQLRNDRFSLLGFYDRRVRRIFPALLAVLVASLIFGALMLSYDAFGSLGEHVAGGAGFIANILLWAESGGAEGSSNFKPMLHLWSLGVEEQFYFLWPLIAWFAWRRHLNFLATIAVVALTSMIANLLMVDVDRVSAFYLPLGRFWELLAGAALVEIEYRRGSLSSALAPYAAGAGLLMVTISLFVIRVEQAFPGAIALLPVVGTVLIIAAGRETGLKRLIFGNRVVIAIGLISYPLYLWHWPLVSFGYILEGGTPEKIVRIGLIALSFVLATLTYLLVEKPVRFGALKAAPMALPLCGAMIVTGLAGACIAIWAGAQG